MKEPAAPADAAAQPADVDALMARMRAGIGEKLARGVYSEEDLERVRRVELGVRDRAALGPAVWDDVARLHATWDTLGPHAFASQRAGPVGRLVVAAKGLLRRVLRPFASAVLVPQVEFNGAVARLLTGVVHGVEALEESRDALQVRRAGLERRHRELQARCGELLAEVHRLQERLEAFDRPGLPSAAVRSAGAGSLQAAGPSPLSRLAFEEKHRGPSSAVRRQQREYVRHFVNAPGPVFDAGCGRGEFLDLLREEGVPASGVEPDDETAALAREKGLDAVTGDPLLHLAAIPDGFLGGIFAAQVIEHFSSEELARFVRLAHAKLAPGGGFVVETINPTCLATFSGALYLDLSHTRPVHPEALRFLLEGTGFREVALEFTSPFPTEMGLQAIDIARWLHDVDKEFVRMVNDNFGRLNGLVFGHQDYAAIARR